MKPKLIAWKIILKDSFLLSLSRFISQGIGIFTGVLLRRWLGPYNIGIWTAFKIMLGYGEYTNLGSLAAMDREYPRLSGAGDIDKATHYLNTSFGIITSTSLIVGILFSSWALYFKNELSALVSIGLVALAFINFFLQNYNFFIIYFRCEHRFKHLALFYVLSIIFELLMILLFVPGLGILGVYIGILCAYIFNYFFLRITSKLTLKLTLDPETTVKIIGYGVKLIAIGILTSLFRDMDKIMIGMVLGSESLGLYSIPMMAFGLVMSAAETIETVQRPSVQEAFGEASSASYIQTFIIIPIEGLCFFMPLFLVGIYAFLPPFVHTVLPAFVLGLEPLPWLLMAYFFYTTTIFTSSFIITLQKNRLLIILLILFVIISAIVNRLVIMRGGEILAVSVVTLVLFFIYASVLMLYVCKKIKNSMFFRSLITESCMLIYIILCVFILNIFIKKRESWTGAFIYFILFLGLYMPVINIYEKKRGFFKRFFQLIKDYFSSSIR